MNKQKEFEILNDEKFNDFLNKNGEQFRSFLSAANVKLMKELDKGEHVVTLIEDYINN